MADQNKLKKDGQKQQERGGGEMIKCPSCKAENKDTAKNCKKCGTILNLQPMWSPTWQWHARALGFIYAGLIVVFFTLNFLLKPYLRQIPPEVTPWLKSAQNIHK